MKKFNKNIDMLVSKILNEEIENKVKKITEEINSGEWKEIEVGEALHGKQKKLDVAKPKGKLTADDFKKLRKDKTSKKEVDEWFYFGDEDNKSVPGDYEGDEDAENDAEKLSSKEPTYVGKGLSDNKPGKMFGSFDDEHGWFDQDDREHGNEFDFDFDEEEFRDFDSFMGKHGKDQKWFGQDGKKMFKTYQDKFGGKPFRVRTPKSMEESETEEGNAFSGALAKAKEDGKSSFEVDGKKFNVKEEKKGSLHKKLGINSGSKLPISKLKSLKTELSNKAKGSKKLSEEDSNLLKQVNLALTLKSLRENTDKLTLTEDELVDMIEKIVLEQKAKDADEKSTLDKKTPEGLKKTVKVQNLSKKENDEYAKSVVKKMKEYVKAGSNGEYKETTEEFPKSNYQMSKDEKIMKYNPSDAVEEYIEAFAYPGMTNLVYDEIKPDDTKIDKYLKGDSTTGNAVKDKDGKALGNVVPSKVGDRFKKNYDENLYGAEQMKGSYKRQPQPVDVGGSEKLEGSLKSIKKGSTAKANKIMSQLESEDKKGKVVNEELNKMKNLIIYNRKTQ
jgi:hypothetical protein